MRNIKRYFLETFHKLTFNWEIFSHNFGWQGWHWFISSPISKGAMFVPILGYMIIFNDEISSVISFNNITGGSNFQIIENYTRLQFVYFGLILLGLSNFLYLLRRPRVMRFGVNDHAFADYGIKHFTTSTYIEINALISEEGHRTIGGKYYNTHFDGFKKMCFGEGEGTDNVISPVNWEEAVGRYEHILRGMLMDYFFRKAITRRLSLSICIIVSLIGYSLLTFCSVELFARVVAASFNAHI